ncbi:uncharacterized protein PG986_014158 [Apiospora aurea]|uniref:Uncharacterized protein n=1 Tax=Apiospora aurea TaxID=335848 RepID=A0ABR1PS67_9PEZI
MFHFNIHILTFAVTSVVPLGAIAPVAEAPDLDMPAYEGPISTDYEIWMPPGTFATAEYPIRAAYPTAVVTTTVVTSLKPSTETVSEAPSSTPIGECDVVKLTHCT